MFSYLFNVIVKDLNGKLWQHESIKTLLLQNNATFFNHLHCCRIVQFCLCIYFFCLLGFIFFLPWSLLFWTDWDKNDPRIERALMDGSNRTSLKSSGLKYPNGLAIDFSSNRLYWCDAGQDNIGSMSFDGASIKVHYANLPHPFGLVIYKDKIFWTDWQTESIYRGSKSRRRKTVMKKDTENLYGVRVFAKENQPGTVWIKRNCLFKRTCWIISFSCEHFSLRDKGANNSVSFPVCFHPLWRRANARDVSFETLNGSQFTL